MNHQYRTVFNRALGVWQAVSESAKSHGKAGKSAVATPSSSHGFHSRAFLRPLVLAGALAGIFLFGAPAPALAQIFINGAGSNGDNGSGYDGDGDNGASGGTVSFDNNANQGVPVGALSGVSAFTVTANGGNGGSGGYGTLVFVGNGGEGGNGGNAGSAYGLNGATLSTDGTLHHGMAVTAIGGNGGIGGGSLGLVFADEGDGGHAGAGGLAEGVTSASSVIITTGANAFGLYVDASGGNGGTGGNAVTAGYGNAGEGGNAANAGTAIGRNAGQITTSGYASYGMLVRAAGGKGGDGNKTEALFAGAGSNGGPPTVGGVVIAENSGAIVTRGDYASGMVAQSVGGAGGNGGGAFGLFYSGGGSATDGNDGNTVTAANTGAITTNGVGAIGMLIESVGGGGGDGGGVLSGFVSVGGTGGGGGNGGAVNANIGGVITTGADGSGNGAHGVLAQSVGGGGGSGGYAVAFNPIGIAAVAIGGGGGTGGNGGIVNVNAAGSGPVVSTNGASAMGIFAQSVGGGGGNGGGAFALGGVVSVSVGGSGAAAGDGGEVNYNVGNANVTTLGVDSAGILIQSVGGGGGNGGFALGGAGGVAVSVGGAGAAGGIGGKVDATTGGVVNTFEDRSIGIIAQSIGGGGGNGGFVVGGSLGATVGVGGDGGAGGDGGLVFLRAAAAGESVTTRGADSAGVVVQSIGGGGGNGGIAGTFGVAANVGVGGSGGSASRGMAVDATYNGSVDTFGPRSAGIIVQSIGGGGGNGGGVLGIGPGVSVGIGGSGGGGGNAGAVNFRSTSGLNITTRSEDSAGVIVQSVGGGGGNGGFAFGGLGIVSVDIGGSGGAAGDADSVNVAISGGGITTMGARSTGLIAQSIGGGGGNGGGSAGTAVIGVSIGGKGAGGGEGRAVDVVSGASIVTEGLQSHGILAQSIGGGGGSGGFAVTVGGPSFSLGGAGGAGGGSEKVRVVNSGAITTGNDLAIGLFAQSLGGSGGDGGFAGAGGAFAAVSIGGGGGAGGAGGQVEVVNNASITTGGELAHGILAQSIGGGGGNGGSAVGVAAGVFGAAGVAIGGGGGAGNFSEQVSVTHNGDIHVGGAGAKAILAQSVGGSGGNGGSAYSGAFSAGLYGSAAVSVSIGGTGGDGGEGRAVAVKADGNLIADTDAAGSGGIVAQSIGGGGGNGGRAISVAGSVSTGVNVSLGVTVGGWGGDGGRSGLVTVDTGLNSGGSIVTLGDQAVGILAQSVAGSGGNGGDSTSAAGGYGVNASINATVAIGGGGGDGNVASDVLVNNAMTIRTGGDMSSAILAQSIGGGGGNGGSSDGTTADAGIGSGVNIAVNVGVGGSGGSGNLSGAVSVINRGNLTTSGDFASGIVAQSLGGGGGMGGAANAKAFHLGGTTSTSVTVDVGIGGSGGSGNDAAMYRYASDGVTILGAGVQVDNAGVITTSGFNSIGILAMSVGGGGGGGGAAAAEEEITGAGSAGDTSVSIGAAIGLAAGGAGHGGTVSVINRNRIETNGADSHGISANSIGGGGGVGGSATSGVLGEYAIGGALGGAGGGAGNGARVDVVNTTAGTIWTHQERSVGIFAQSVGGGGGAGGAGSSTGAEGATVAVNLALGASGAGGGAGGEVHVDNSALLITDKAHSHGILAQSIGGSGGMGGASGTSSAGADVAIGFSLGGFGGDGGQSALVRVNNFASASILTQGDDSHGIFAQSVGGGGGAAGGGSTEAGQGDVAVTLTMGGIGGAGNSGGTVEVNNASGIETRGYLSHGIFAQSVGGGGGASGVAASTLKADINIGGQISLPAGSGANGGQVTVDNSGTIWTHNGGSNGIFAQSVGGGGGAGGVVSGSAAGDNSISLGLGGFGGDGGAGARVQVANAASGLILTEGDDSHGIFAQSVGGGGGTGGAVSSASSAGDLAVALDIGGMGGGGNSGGTVDVDNAGGIETLGLLSHGIFAQSVGGGGGASGAAAGTQKADLSIGGQISLPAGGGANGGQVTVDNSGTIWTHNGGSNGIFAQSVGGGGGAGGVVSGSAAGDNSISLGLGGFGGDGGAGARVQVANAASGLILTQGDDSHGIFAQSVGGGGGTGGAVSSTSSAGDLAVALDIGGMGGGGGNGGEVIVGNAGRIETKGLLSHAIFAQSVGGGGGASGAAASTVKADLNIGGQISLPAGGGADGGLVTVENSGVIWTRSSGSNGIFAQSVGGGGGAGGVVSGSAAGDNSIGFGLGGFGGSGGAGKLVHVTNSASGLILTQGDDSHGIFAQSVGGGGGAGGAVSSASTASDLAVTMSIGGVGGAGSAGGEVLVDNFGGIETQGYLSHGIFAQSVGGGGGASGAAAISAKADTNIGGALAGPAGGGANGGRITVNHAGIIETWKDGSLGIFAQSVGGGGGYGGVVSNDAAGDSAFTFSLGGLAGSGGNGGEVNVTVTGDIVTHGERAHGVVAQSVGGGGGYGGDAKGKASNALALGGLGGDGGDGGDVTVIRTGNITTLGKDSIAIIAQSVGGGGGIGGAGFGRFGASEDGGSGLDNNTVGFTSPSGGRGTGGKVTIIQDGAIDTQGDRAHGIVAQAVGGGGGFAGNLDLGMGSSGAGSQGGIGDAAAVSATALSLVQVRGASAYALFGQSATGQGNSGAVDLTAMDSLFATGADSVAAYGESTSGSAKGDITLNLNGAYTIGGSNTGVAAMLVGGANNTLNNKGLLLAWDAPADVTLGTELKTVLGNFSPMSITGTSGNDQVNNQSTAATLGRVIGNIDLGGGLNGFHNYANSSVIGLTRFDLGGGTLLNDGLVSHKGIGVVGSVDVNGGYTQSASGALVTDIDLTARLSDFTRISGAGDFNGTTPINFLSIDRLFDRDGYVIAQGASMATAMTPTLARPAVGFDFQTRAVNGTDLTLFSNAPAMKSLIQRPASGVRDPGAVQMAEYFDGLETQGALYNQPSELARMINMLRFLPNEQEFGRALMRLTPHYAVHTFEIVNQSVNAVLDPARNCEHQTHSYSNQDRCVWITLSPQARYKRNPGQSASTRDDEYKTFSFGGIGKINGNWALGLTLGHTDVSSRIDFNGERLSRTNGDIWQAHALAKYKQDTYFADFSLGGGAGKFRGSRDTTLTQAAYIPGETLGGQYLDEMLHAGIGNSVAYRQRSRHFGASARLGITQQYESFYVQPTMQIDARHLRVSGEEQGSIAAMRFSGSSNVYVSATPGVELGTHIDLPNDARLRMYANGGVEFSNKDWTIEGQFNAAEGLGGPPLKLRQKAASPLYRAGLGIEVTSAKGFGFALHYGGAFSKQTRMNAVSAMFKMQF